MGSNDTTNAKGIKMINQSYVHAYSIDGFVDLADFCAMGENYIVERDMPTFEDEDFVLTPIVEDETLGDEYGAYLDELAARDRAMLNMENSWNDDAYIRSIS